MGNDQGVKHDQGKADLSLLSYDALTEIARAFEFGAKKYGRYNYLGGMEWTRIGGALLRHTYAWLWGEDYDEESGIHHLGHAGACVVMLLDYVLKGLGKDNRYKSIEVEPKTNIKYIQLTNLSQVVKGDKLICLDNQKTLSGYHLELNKIYTVAETTSFYVIVEGIDFDFVKERFGRMIE